MFSLYTYNHAIIIVIIIYLAFSFWCHWWVNNIECAVRCTVACVKSSKNAGKHCTRCRLLQLHASWPCKNARCLTTHSIHTDSLFLFRSDWLAPSFWQSWYSYEGRNLTVATHEVYNASRLLAINYRKSLEKLFQLKWSPCLKHQG